MPKILSGLNPQRSQRLPRSWKQSTIMHWIHDRGLNPRKALLKFKFHEYPFLGIPQRAFPSKIPQRGEQTPSPFVAHHSRNKKRKRDEVNWRLILLLLLLHSVHFYHRSMLASSLLQVRSITPLSFYTYAFPLLGPLPTSKKRTIFSSNIAQHANILKHSYIC